MNNIIETTSKPISFAVATGNPEIDYKNLKIDDDGYPIRTSHSSYVGEPYRNSEGKIAHMYFDTYSSPQTYIGLSRISEHGVFASTDFATGQTIEEAKIVLLDTTTETCKDWALMRYAMILNCDCDICKINGKTLFLPTGNVMLYNHAETPNAVYVVEKSVKKIKIVALTDIKKGQEITIHYGTEYEKLHSRIPDVYPAPTVPEGFPALAKTTSSCKTCGQQAQPVIRNSVIPQNIEEVKIDVEQKFRSMIVPENIIND